ncbi:hypothetical protein RUM43_013163 [Polyplax serrata]|uniref:Uncharacterized protein n=1 Tax=Polyplax serrata TaxID=468196 RepID=A0AAN8S301_POLSC
MPTKSIRSPKKTWKPSGNAESSPSRYGSPGTERSENLETSAWLTCKGDVPPREGLLVQAGVGSRQGIFKR